MRSLACAALAFSAFALVGCAGSSNDDDDGDQVAWTAEHLVDLDDASLVAEFTAYATSVDEPWERTPVTVVAEMFRLESSDNPNVSLVSHAAAEAAETATVTVTHSRLLDDSVEATRSVVKLRREGDVWQVEEVESSVSCKPGRGHQDFADEDCI